MLSLFLLFACSNDQDSGDDTADTGALNRAPSIAAVTVSNPEYGQALDCSYTGFTDPDGDPDHSRMAWWVNQIKVEETSAKLAGPFSAWDTVFCEVTPFDGQIEGETISSEKVHTPCPSADDTSEETCVFIDSSKPKAVPAHFSGFNVQLFHDGWQPWDDRLVAWTRDLTPGTLRFPGGGSSYVYEWNTGDVADEMIEEFDENDQKFSHFQSYQETVRGKGYLKIQDFSRLAQQTGGRLVVSVNAMTDSPESIGDFARDILSKDIDIAVYELTNEAIYWAHSNSVPRFWMGGFDYVLDMLEYYTAIEEAYAEFSLDTPVITISTSDGGDSPNQTLFDGAQLADGYDGEEELGIAGFGSDWDSDASHEKYWEQWTHHWYPGRTKYRVDGEDIAVDSEDETELNAQIETHWPIFLADLNYQIAENTTGILEDYFVPLHGDPHWGSGAPAHFKANISEYNLRFTTPYTNSLFSAVNAVESVLRWSTEDRVAKVGFHQLVGNCIGALENHRQTAKAAWHQNEVVTDSRDHNYGLFWTVPCLGVQMTNRVVNTAQVSLDTQVFGMPMVTGAEAIYDDTTYRYTPQAETPVDGLFAQAYLGRAGQQHLLLTHRGLTTRTLTVIVDGERLDGGVSQEQLHHSDPLFANVGDASQDLAIETATASFPLALAPYSVLALHWTPAANPDAPNPAKNLSAETDGNRVRLHWSPQAGATGYRVKWGASPGLYNFTQDTTATELRIGPYQSGISVYATVSALQSDGESLHQSANAPELIHLTASPPTAQDNFETDLGDWAELCASESLWTVSNGAVTTPGTSKNCLVHNHSSTNQVIRAKFWINDWNSDSENPRIGLMGRVVNEDQYIVAYLDKSIEKARILSIRDGEFEVIGRSALLDDSGVFDLNQITGKWVNLKLELDGQTLRFSVGVDGAWHLVAATNDPDSEFDQGQAGFYSRKQAANFDEFELR